MLRGIAAIAFVAAGTLYGFSQPVHGSSPSTAETRPAPATVRLLSCSPAHASAVFYGRMRSVPGSERMSMRFGLLERIGDGRFQPVRAPRLARWRRSRPGVAVFGYRQRVRGLAEDAIYRARVDFRWHDADGRVVLRAQRRSRPCSQAGPLPNLRARLAGSGPTATPGVSRYAVRVSNWGDAPAEQVGVGLAVDGSAVDTQTVSQLEPGQSRLLEFRGPRCQTSVRTTADPAAAVRESDEEDNSETLTCDQLRRR
jgi:CARDB